MSQAKTYSLYELTNALRRCIEHSFDGRYWIRAEASELKRNAISGHVYLELVEKGPMGRTVAKARAMIWSQTYAELAERFVSITGMAMAAGMEMLLLVSITYHEQFGLSLLIHNIDPSYTLGEAARRRQEIIKRLKAEGLFDTNRNKTAGRPLQRLAVISSSTAAGYEDFVHHLGSSAEGYCFYTRLYTAVMQGDKTESSVLDALDRVYAHADRYDAIIIIRGGGAVSELSAFDSEAIARAVACAPLPVFCGIGHERDESVVDLVAALSLKTPTAVADYIVDLSRREDALIADLAARALSGSRVLTAAYADRLSRCAYTLPILVQQKTRGEESRLTRLQTELASSGQKYIEQRRRTIERWRAAIPLLASSLQERQASKIDVLRARMKAALLADRQQRDQKIEAIDRAIRISHPDNILKRGFAIIRAQETIVSRAKTLRGPTDITIRFADGSLRARTFPDVKDLSSTETT